MTETHLQLISKALVTTKVHDFSQCIATLTAEDLSSITKQVFDTKNLDIISVFIEHNQVTMGITVDDVPLIQYAIDSQNIEAVKAICSSNKLDVAASIDLGNDQNSLIAYAVNKNNTEIIEIICSDPTNDGLRSFIPKHPYLYRLVLEHAKSFGNKSLATKCIKSFDGDSCNTAEIWFTLLEYLGNNPDILSQNKNTHLGTSFHEEDFGKIMNRAISNADLNILLLRNFPAKFLDAISAKEALYNACVKKISNLKVLQQWDATKFNLGILEEQHRKDIFDKLVTQRSHDALRFLTANYPNQFGINVISDNSMRELLRDIKLPLGGIDQDTILTARVLTQTSSHEFNEAIWSQILYYDAGSIIKQVITEDTDFSEISDITVSKILIELLSCQDIQQALDLINEFPEKCKFNSLSDIEIYEILHSTASQNIDTVKFLIKNAPTKFNFDSFNQEQAKELLNSIISECDNHKDSVEALEFLTANYPNIFDLNLIDFAIIKDLCMNPKSSEHTANTLKFLIESQNNKQLSDDVLRCCIENSQELLLRKVITLQTNLDIISDDQALNILKKNIKFNNVQLVKHLSEIAPKKFNLDSITDSDAKTLLNLLIHWTNYFNYNEMTRFLITAAPQKFNVNSWTNDEADWLLECFVHTSRDHEIEMAQFLSSAAPEKFDIEKKVRVFNLPDLARNGDIRKIKSAIKVKPSNINMKSGNDTLVTLINKNSILSHEEKKDFCQFAFNNGYTPIEDELTPYERSRDAGLRQQKEAATNSAFNGPMTFMFNAALDELPKTEDRTREFNKLQDQIQSLDYVTMPAPLTNTISAKVTDLFKNGFKTMSGEGYTADELVEACKNFIGDVATNPFPTFFKDNEGRDVSRVELIGAMYKLDPELTLWMDSLCEIVTTGTTGVTCGVGQKTKFTELLRLMNKGKLGDEYAALQNRTEMFTDNNIEKIGELVVQEIGTKLLKLDYKSLDGVLSPDADILKIVHPEISKTINMMNSQKNYKLNLPTAKELMSIYEAIGIATNNLEQKQKMLQNPPPKNNLPAVEPDQKLPVQQDQKHVVDNGYQYTMVDMNIIIEHSNNFRNLAANHNVSLSPIITTLLDRASRHEIVKKMIGSNKPSITSLHSGGQDSGGHWTTLAIVHIKGATHALHVDPMSSCLPIKIKNDLIACGIVEKNIHLYNAENQTGVSCGPRTLDNMRTLIPELNLIQDIATFKPVFPKTDETLLRDDLYNIYNAAVQAQEILQNNQNQGAHQFQEYSLNEHVAESLGQDTENLTS